MYFLIDECCAPGLATVAIAKGHVAQRTVDVDRLGYGASDAAIFAFARRAGAVVVTSNTADFRALSRGVRHSGVVALPPLREPGQSRLFRRAIPVIVVALTGTPGAFLIVEAGGTMKVVV